MRVREGQHDPRRPGGSGGSVQGRSTAGRRSSWSGVRGRMEASVARAGREMGMGGEDVARGGGHPVL